MKTILLLPLVLTLPVFAGPMPSEVVAPAQVPCEFRWFAGGSVGYLTELEEPMYTLHLGSDTGWSLGGWCVAIFAEVGYADKDDDWSGRGEPIIGPTLAADNPADFLDVEDGGSFSLDDLDDLLDEAANYSVRGTSYDLDVLPITLNVKLERELTGNLNGYFGGGLGAARVDLDVDAGDFGDFSDDDWVFVAQLFAGLAYDFTEQFEIYGGVRWIYFDDADLSDGGVGGTLELDDDFLFELGARFNF